MIQRLVSIIVGGIVAFLLLLLFDDGRIVGEETTGYLVAVVVGALVNLLWPLIWGTYTTRRTRGLQQASVRAEVQRELEAERRPVEDVEELLRVGAAAARPEPAADAAGHDDGVKGHRKGRSWWSEKQRGRCGAGFRAGPKLLPARPELQTPASR